MKTFPLFTSLVALILSSLTIVAADLPSDASFLQLAGGSTENFKIRLLTGGTLVLAVPATLGAAPFRWTKNGSPVALPEGGQERLSLNALSQNDAGVYGVYSNNLAVQVSNLVQIEIEKTGAFSNVSSRVKIQPGNDVQICGIVVEGNAPKHLLVRAVGPSLRSFGIAAPVERPRFSLRNANGGEVSLSSDNSPQTPAYWNNLFSRAGAFPLSGGEEQRVAFNTGTLPSGVYTILAFDDSRKGGELLIEVYEIK